MILQPTPPEIDFGRLPRDEQERAHFIDIALRQLQYFTEDFEAAICLFDYAIDRQLKHNDLWPASQLMFKWCFIAARDGAFTIYNFNGTITTIIINLNKSPTLLSLVDTAKRRDATRKFKRSFPTFEAIRNSAGHAGEFWSPEKVAKHRVEGSPFFAINNLHDRTYSSMVDGKNVSYDLSRESLQKLVEVRDTFYSAFSGAVRSR